MNIVVLMVLLLLPPYDSTNYFYFFGFSARTLHPDQTRKFFPKMAITMEAQQLTTSSSDPLLLLHNDSYLHITKEGVRFQLWSAHTCYVEQTMLSLLNNLTPSNFQEFKLWVQTMFPEFSIPHTPDFIHHITSYVAKKRSFMLSIEAICNDPKSPSESTDPRLITLIDWIGHTTKVARFSYKFELPTTEDRFLQYPSTFQSVYTDTNSTWHVYFEADLSRLVQNLFAFHQLPFSTQLATEAHHFLRLCIHNKINT
jgi:hypothetical protein